MRKSNRSTRNTVRMTVELPKGKTATLYATGSRGAVRLALENFLSIVMIASNPTLSSSDIDEKNFPDPVTHKGVEITWNGENFEFYIADNGSFSPFVLTIGFIAG